MKLIIPMAEKSTGLGPHSHTTPKALIHVAGKPLIAHVLDSVSDLKIDKVVFIVDENYPELREHIKKNYSFEAVYIKQRELKGSAHAIYGAKKHALNDEVLVLFGDSLVEANLSKISKCEHDGCIWTKKVDDPRDFGVVFLYEGKITRLIEKPDNPISDHAMVGMYYFKKGSDLFDAIQHILKHEITTDNAFQLTDAIQVMINNGLFLSSENVDDWLDCGSIPNLLKANNYLLEKNRGRTISGDNSVIIKPVFIEDGVQVRNSIIGPFVSVGKGVSIKNSIIKNSIINEGAEIKDASLSECMIGKHTVVKGAAKKLNIGDASEVHFT